MPSKKAAEIDGETTESVKGPPVAEPEIKAVPPTRDDKLKLKAKTLGEEVLKPRRVKAVEPTEILVDDAAVRMEICPMCHTMNLLVTKDEEA